MIKIETIENLKSQINNLDYQLYELTEEEKKFGVVMRFKELNYFNKQICDSLKLFEERIYGAEYQNIFNEGEAIKKSIFIKELDILNSNGENYKHNCIPCNFTDGANLIWQYLKANLKCENIRLFVTIYSFLLYQQAERFGVVYLRLGYKDKKNEFDWNQFPKLQKLKYWANFFKHPKSSMFLHHPTFHIESYDDNPSFKFEGIIDTDFVKRYYSGPKHNNELEVLMLNQNFKIFFPDLIEFTKLICEESESITKFIKTDDNHIDKLRLYGTDYI